MYSSNVEAQKHVSQRLREIRACIAEADMLDKFVRVIIYHYRSRKGGHMRLDKYLADASLGTRSELKQLIRKGKVLVDGQPVTNPGFSLSGEEEIRYNGSVVLSQRLKYYMFYKPAGCVSATQDRERTVLDFFQPADGKDLFPVGRLDKDTEGLLLMTNDGAFAHKITNPKKHVAKLYYFEGTSEFSEDATEQIEKGLDIGDDTPTRPAQIAYIKCVHNLHDVYDNMIRSHNSHGAYDACDERNLSGNYEKTLTINILSGQQIQDTACDTRGLLQITEGRYHQVKRMLKKCGVTVVYLKRLAVGGLYLDETLEKGTYRALTEEDFEKLGVK